MDIIEKIYAIVGDDETGEGVWSYKFGETWMPLIGADTARLESFLPLAESMSKACGKPYKVLEFSVRADITTECKNIYLR